MTQLDLLDAPPSRTEAEKTRDAKRDMEDRRQLEIERLRRCACRAARLNSYGTRYGEPLTVTADDVRKVAGIETQKRTHKNPETCNNIMGAVFDVPYFEPTGEWHRSNTPGSHRNLLRIWRYLPDVKKRMMVVRRNTTDNA